MQQHSSTGKFLEAENIVNNFLCWLLQQSVAYKWKYNSKIITSQFSSNKSQSCSIFQMTCYLTVVHCAANSEHLFFLQQIVFTHHPDHREWHVRFPIHHLQLLANRQIRSYCIPQKLNNASQYTRYIYSSSLTALYFSW